MNQGIPNWFMNAYPQERLDQLFTARDNFGKQFFYSFFNLRGTHLFIIGNTRSGKTIKKQGVLWWLSKFETIIEFDTGKPGDLEAFFDSPDPETKFNLPVQVLIPYGCEFEIKGVPSDIEYQITQVISPGRYFDLIKPGWINIISLRNYFSEDTALKQYLIEMFHGFDQRARLGEFSKFCPCTISIDEAHSMMGTQGVNTDAESIILTQYLSRWQRELAASRIRTVITSQRYKDVPPSIRDNSPCYIVCRGTSVENSDNPAIHYVSGFARKAKCNEGWWIIDGQVFYHDNPMPFRNYQIPVNIKIDYGSSKADLLEDSENDELLQVGRIDFTGVPAEQIRSSLAREDLPEDLPDLGVYSKYVPKRTRAKNAS